MIQTNGVKMRGENESSSLDRPGRRAVGRVGVRKAVAGRAKEGGKKNMTSCPAGSVSSSLDSL